VHTQRLVESEDLIVVGAQGMYEARCRRCFEPNPAQAQKDTGPQLLVRTRATGGAGQ
jgi:thymidine kinase